MQQEIHVESGVEGLGGVAPFRNQHGLRETLVQKLPHLAPEL